MDELKFDLGFKQLFTVVLRDYFYFETVGDLLTWTSLLQELRRDEKPSSFILPYVSHV